MTPHTKKARKQLELRTGHRDTPTLTKEIDMTNVPPTADITNAPNAGNDHGAIEALSQHVAAVVRQQCAVAGIAGVDLERVGRSEFESITGLDRATAIATYTGVVDYSIGTLHTIATAAGLNAAEILKAAQQRRFSDCLVAWCTAVHLDEDETEMHRGPEAVIAGTHPVRDDWTGIYATTSLSQIPVDEPLRNVRVEIDADVDDDGMRNLALELRELADVLDKIADAGLDDITGADVVAVNR